MITSYGGRKAAGRQSREARTQSRPAVAAPKESVRVGCWNVRTMFSVEKTAQIVKKARRYKLRILSISECCSNYIVFYIVLLFLDR